MDEEQDRAELIPLRNAWMAAWRDWNRGTLEQILGEEFTLTIARMDKLLDRQTWLDMAMERVRNQSSEYRDFMVLIHGDAAVAKGGRPSLEHTAREGLLTTAVGASAGGWVYRTYTRRHLSPS